VTHTAFRYTLATFSLCLFVIAPALAVDWNHDPASPIGPELWGELDPAFSACGAGSSQSPVDIAVTARGGGAALRPDYHDVPLEIENNGHAIEVPYALVHAPASALRIGDEVYELLQFHFHAPSEHEVAGELADMEMHLVHQDLSGNQIAVVGVLLVVGPEPNPVVELIFAHAPDEEGVVDLDGTLVNAKQVLPGFLETAANPDAPFVLTSYWSYSGSLTTPPCTEGVRWFVLKEPLQVSAETVERMHELVRLFPHYDGYPSNNRPVLPLHDRVITDRGP
jgi:carbonic anhydrase